MSKGSAWGVLGLASIIACLHAVPARAVWAATETPHCRAPAVATAPVVATESSAIPVAPSEAKPPDEVGPAAQPENGEVAIVDLALDESPAPEILAASGRTCCFYKSGFSPDPVVCRDRTCVPIGEQCPTELHGCPFWTSFTVNSCGACR